MLKEKRYYVVLARYKPTDEVNVRLVTWDEEYAQVVVDTINIYHALQTKAWYECHVSSEVDLDWYCRNNSTGQAYREEDIV